MWTLLIADDERTIREGIARSINWKRLGISRVFLAADGQEAYTLIKKERPDIAILDIIMPEMTGLEVISRIGKQSDRPQFVILSGYGEFHYAQEAMRHEVRDYILKPCDLEEIFTTIARVIQQIEEQQSIAAQHAHLESYVDLLEPRAQEQILRDFIIGNSPKNGKLFAEVFQQAGKTVQLLLFSFSDPDHFNNLPTLKRCIDNDTVITDWKFSAILRDGIVLVFNVEAESKIKAAVQEICQAAARLSIHGIRAAVSAEGPVEQLPKMYENAAEAVRIFSPPSDAIPLIEASTAQYSKPVRQIIHYVKDNLSNSNLSLNQIAAEVLFLNPDYLSKLFKKECGLKFSDYLMTIRMEKAKQLITVCDDLKMYEVARRVGLGDNAAYFGQVFRKYTGLLPSEYKHNQVK